MDAVFIGLGLVVGLLLVALLIAFVRLVWSDHRDNRPTPSPTIPSEVRAAREAAAREALHAPVPPFSMSAPCQKCGNGSGGHIDKGFGYRHYEAADPNAWIEYRVKDYMRGQQPQGEHVVRECLCCGHVTYSLPWGGVVPGEEAP